MVKLTDCPHMTLDVYPGRKTAIQHNHTHWLGAYRTNALYSGHIFVHFNDLEDVFT